VSLLYNISQASHIGTSYSSVDGTSFKIIIKGALDHVCIILHNSLGFPSTIISVIDISFWLSAKLALHVRILLFSLFVPVPSFQLHLPLKLGTPRIHTE
jgi:hypothetical protein